MRFVAVLVLCITCDACKATSQTRNNDALASAADTNPGAPSDSAVPSDVVIPSQPDSRSTNDAPAAMSTDLVAQSDTTTAAPDLLAPDLGVARDTASSNANCPWRLPGTTGAVAQDPVTVATPFAAPDNQLTFTPPAIPCAVFPITDYGAKGDGTTKNTTAFAQAIAAATVVGGGVVRVTAGNWLTGPIHLASRIELHLDAGASILFSQTINDYLPAVATRWEGLDMMNWSPLVYAQDCSDVAITGPGTFNGQGTVWSSWKIPSKQEDQRIYDYYVARLPLDPAKLPTLPQSAANPGLRPAFIEWNHCTNVLIDGPAITGSPYWTLHPLYSNNVIIRNVRIDTTATSSNGDGVDPDSSTNVLIENSTFATSDDCIAIKSGLNEPGIAVGKPSRNIVIRNITTTTGHGGVAIGSEMSGGVNNVYVTASNLQGLGQPLRVKTLPGRGGAIHDLWFADGLTLGWNTVAIELTTQYISSTIPPHDASLVPTLTGINLRGISGTGVGPVYAITGPLTGLRLQDVVLSGSAGTCTQAPAIQVTTSTLTGVSASATTLPCN